MSGTVPKKSMYPFLPSRLQRGTFLLWLKRTHAWTGLFGALMFVMLGVSGVLLNHRAVMKIDTGAAVEVAALETVVGANAFPDREAFVAWVQEEFGVNHEPMPDRGRRGPPAAVSFEGSEQKVAERWELRFRGPNAIVNASYLPEAGLVELSKTQNNLLGVLKELHKGHGIGIVFILLIDAIAGALMLMSISGFLLWSKLHGPRLAALGIFGASLAWLLLSVWPNWIVGTF